ncbi:unnamed protein product [Eruca vesicaria subsp. sativa]|uniref:Bifunctional inhibitor/plant lipid transfer protein/seed storage helical domain-containing protein n=1 Tax=Eruca vesicaria subsp. sativa TaxID=29727 RepID=A0ABC8LN01_ERUVS|nr:unnamed protein product [Eruca vesicaria subsp. sativa]
MASKFSSYIIFMTINIIFFTLTMASCPTDTSKFSPCVGLFKDQFDFNSLLLPCCSLVQRCLCNQTAIDAFASRVGSFVTIQNVCIRYVSLIPKCE